MAIVIKATDLHPTTTQYSDGIVQNFKLVDITRKSISLGIWNQQVEHFGPLLTIDVADYSVVVAKRIKVKNYKCDVIYMFVPHYSAFE
ncbi:hypothetical protein Leryth_015786 [Lithospermum erythrorhizon]|uniref:Replication protein A OB domain-containing protein n=1 Tax=Lithospermum erythrorhizon TaxID=34254 RepID=A0AAV3PWL1_LITER|nr:hypothetical protein Leryth_015786 [Lithospermum erythrorhizon]